MGNAARIVWNEGLFVRPHHFQYQDSYHDMRLWSALCELHSYPWGLGHVTFATGKKETDVVAITELEAVLPDGSVLDSPHADDLPPPVSLSQLSPDTSTVLVGLSLPTLRPEGGNCMGSAQGGARYAPRETKVPDIFGESGPIQLHVARSQPRITLHTDEPVDAQTLPVARFRRTPSGRFRPDETYIAPARNARDSKALAVCLKELRDAMHGRIATLTASQSEAVREAVAFRAGESATFWLLQALNTAMASLAHLHALPTVAPERIFQELLRLAGSLLAFSRSVDHRSLPAYDHRQADDRFSTLFELIGSLIDTVIPVRHVAVPMPRQRPSHFSGTVAADVYQEDASFYLVAAGDLPPQELMVAIPSRFKIGAPDDVAKAVSSALPCVPLSHVSQPPAAVPVKPGHLYFALDDRSPAFARMRDAGTAAAFAPTASTMLRWNC